MSKCRAALYYRVSGPGQVEAFGYEAQKRELPIHAARMDWQVVAEYEEPGVSGETLVNRPAMMRLLADAQAGKFDVILVIEDTRLSRGQLRDWEYLKGVCDENEVSLATPQGIFYRPGNEDDDFTTDIRGVMSKREKRQILKRMIRGKNQALASGALLMTHAPLGYSFEQYGKKRSEKRLVINPEAAETVRLLFRLSAYGPGDGKQWGRQRICHYLNDTLHILSPRGNRWNPQSLAFIVGNPIYKGVFVSGRTVKTNGRGLHTDSHTLVNPDVIPPIVTEELWEAAQGSLAHRSSHGRGRPARKNPRALLSSFLRCPACGYVFSHLQDHRKNGVYRRYACTGRVQHRSLGINQCPNPRWDGEVLEAAVWATLVEYIESPDLLREAIEAGEQEQAIVHPLDVAAMERAMEATQAAADRVKAAYRAGVYSLDELEAEMATIRREREQLEAGLASAKGEIAARAQRERDVVSALDMIAMYKEAIRGANHEEKRGIIEDLVREVILSPSGEFEIQPHLGQSLRGRAASEMARSSRRFSSSWEWTRSPRSPASA